MTDLLFSNQYFCVALTVVVFSFANGLQQKFKYAILNPIVISAGIIILILTVLDVPNTTYQAGCQMLNYLLTPATICLAISFYEQIGRMKRHLLPIFAGVLAGVVCSAGSIYMLAKLFALPDWMLFSILPKSVTAAIGVALSEEIGGIAAITTASITITGISGHILLPRFCKWFHVEEPIAQGVAIGTSAHVIGTTRAFEMSELAGAAGSLALTIAGLVTSFLLSFLAQYL